MNILNKLRKLLNYFTALDYDTIIFINSYYKYSKYIIQLILAILFICNIVFCFNVCNHSKNILIIKTNINTMLTKYFMSKKKEKDVDRDVFIKVEEGVSAMRELSEENFKEMKKKDEEMKKKDKIISKLLNQLDIKKNKIKKLKAQLQTCEQKLSNYKTFNSTKNNTHCSQSEIRKRIYSKSK